MTSAALKSTTLKSWNPDKNRPPGRFSYARAGRSMHTAMLRASGRSFGAAAFAWCAEASGRSFGAAAFAQRTGAATRLRRRIPTAPLEGQSAPGDKAGGRRPEGKLCPHCNKTAHADQRAPRRINALQRRYDTVSRFAGLDPSTIRMPVAGFRRVNASKLNQNQLTVF